jgi:cytochrome c oxidase subunit III
VSDAAAALHHPAVEPAESPLTPESWGKLGMWVFLAGDAMGFGVLLASYGAMRMGSADWPNPAAVLGIQLTALMTFLLICSSVTMVKALENLKASNLPRAKMFVLLTALGGAIFVGLQVYEWTHLIHRGLMVFGNPWGATLFGASFFIITGFHGMHVTAGVIYLLAIHRVIRRNTDMRYNYMVTEVAGLYWHFVDLVWIMVFTFVYLL